MPITVQDLIKHAMLGGSGGSSGSGGGGLDEFLAGSIVDINSNAEKIVDYAFYYRTGLGTLSFPEATSIGKEVFVSAKLRELNIPKVATIGEKAFNYCMNLSVIRAPSAKTIGGYAVSGAYAVEKAYFPSLVSAGTNVFYNCYTISIADMGKITKLTSNSFRGAYKLRALILRSETLCELPATSVFYQNYRMTGTVNTSYNPDGLHDGYVYAPSVLVEEYKVATNWSALTDFQFRALEDYTVDGTITGELDESKI